MCIRDRCSRLDCRKPNQISVSYKEKTLATSACRSVFVWLPSCHSCSVVLPVMVLCLASGNCWTRKTWWIASGNCWTRKRWWIAVILQPQGLWTNLGVHHAHWVSNHMHSMLLIVFQCLEWIYVSLWQLHRVPVAHMTLYIACMQTSHNCCADIYSCFELITLYAWLV